MPRDDLFAFAEPPAASAPGAPDPPPVDAAAVAPLAERMRPRGLADYVGQQHILAPGMLLRRAVEADRLQSLI